MCAYYYQAKYLLRILKCIPYFHFVDVVVQSYQDAIFESNRTSNADGSPKNGNSRKATLERRTSVEDTKSNSPSKSSNRKSSFDSKMITERDKQPENKLSVPSPRKIAAKGAIRPNESKRLAPRIIKPISPNLGRANRVAGNLSPRGPAVCLCLFNFL